MTRRGQPSLRHERVERRIGRRRTETQRGGVVHGVDAQLLNVQLWDGEKTPGERVEDGRAIAPFDGGCDDGGGERFGGDDGNVRRTWFVITSRVQRRRLSRSTVAVPQRHVQLTDLSSVRACFARVGHAHGESVVRPCHRKQASFEGVERKRERERVSFE